MVAGGADDEGDDESDGAGEAGEVTRVRPAPVGALDDAERKQADPERQLGGAEQVGAAVLGFAHLLQYAGRDDCGDDPDRDVDDEDPAPAELHQQTPDRRSERRGDAADGRPDADRQRPLLDREGGEDEAERGRQHHRPAHRLQDPGRDQDVERGSDRAEEQRQRHAARRAA